MELLLQGGGAPRIHDSLNVSHRQQNVTEWGLNRVSMHISLNQHVGTL